MKLPTELILLISAITATPVAARPPSLAHRSTPFPELHGLTHLSADYSTREAATHPTKFFHESTFSPHYDGRFASTELPHHMRHLHLRLMLKAYMATMNRIGVRSWLMHGCLLGWWWNGRIMPWDNDVDVMVDEHGMSELGSWWNMSVHAFSGEELGVSDPQPEVELGRSHNSPRDMDKHREAGIAAGKRYLLEVNPRYVNVSTRDAENVIDARWIDTSTGLFIDITTIHAQPPSTQKPSSSSFPSLYTKDQHSYLASQIFPLRRSTFESIPIRIPYDAESLLLDEYGPQALTQRWFKDWLFDKERQKWVLVDGMGEEVGEENEELVLERLMRTREKMDYLARVAGKGSRNARE